MLTEEQAIVVALIRCAMYNATAATRWQAIRLYNQVKDTEPVYAAKILNLVAEGPHERAHVRMTRSFESEVQV